MEKEKIVMEEQTCKHTLTSIRDTLDVVGGKWKLILLFVLFDGKKKFNEICRETGISPRILSKELQELEINGLISRRVCDTKPITVEYELTEYSKTLSELITAMCKWGKFHRQKIVSSVDLSV